MSLYLLSGAANAVVVTVEPDQPTLQSSCLAFGAGGFQPVLPFMGLMYRNLPPFDLAPGDTLAFDLSAMNDADVEIDIEIADFDPPSLEAGPFTKIVSNSQTPTNPRGDDIFGNYEAAISGRGFVQLRGRRDGAALLKPFTRLCAGRHLHPGGRDSCPEHRPERTGWSWAIRRRIFW
jgi:hypothetical protein